MTDSGPPRAWDRLPDEGTKAYEAFCTYRDAGAARSISKTARQLHKNAVQLKRWSSNNDWVERAAEYDSYIDRKALKKAEDKLVETRARHIVHAKLIQEKAMARFEGMTEEELEQVPAHTLLKMVETATKIELVALGEHTGDEIIIRESAMDAAAKYLKAALEGEDPDAVGRILNRLRRGREVNGERGEG